MKSLLKSSEPKKEKKNSAKNRSTTLHAYELSSAVDVLTTTHFDFIRLNYTSSSEKNIYNRFQCT